MRIADTYHSLGPNIVRVLPSTCVTFLVYENTKRYLPLFYNEEMNQDTGHDRPPRATS